MTAKSGNKMSALLMTLVVPLWLGGCSVASVVGSNSEPPPAIIDLAAPAAGKVGHLPLQLVIHEPTAVDALAGSRIAVKPAASEITYFPGVAWADKLPRLLKLRLVQAFERSRAVRAVSGGEDRLRADVALSWEVRDFQVEVNNGAARALASAYVKVVDEDAGRLVSSQSFSVAAPAANDTPQAGVEALQQAFSELSVKVMRWVAARRIVVVDASTPAVSRQPDAGLPEPARENVEHQSVGTSGKQGR